MATAILSTSTANETKKNCSKCKRLLPLSRFSPDNRTLLGVGSQCKQCNCERMRRHGAKNKAVRSAYNRSYRERNKERLVEANKKWREANKHIISQTRRNQYRANRDKIIAAARAYNAKNRDSINAKQRAYYSTRKDEHRARNYKWRKANPEKLHAHLKARRALKLGACKGGLTAKQWRDIKAASGFRCVYCGETPDTLTQDHFIPLVKGGPHAVGNVVPACLPCNCKKWANHKDVLPEFRSLIHG